jgi:hypothetical protein
VYRESPYNIIKRKSVEEEGANKIEGPYLDVINLAVLQASHGIIDPLDQGHVLFG